jgi:hypothetical protein
MHSQLFIIVSLLASNIIALPLNINLGAYSPALVVGDGEISFGGKQDVANLMNALEGAAVSGAAANGAPAPAPAPAPAASAPAEAAASTPPITEAQVTDQPTQIAALQGMGKEIAPRVVKLEQRESVEKRDLAGFDRALKYATDALKTGPKVQLGTGEGGSGVGIIVDAGVNAPAAAKPATPPAGEAQAAAVKEIRSNVNLVPEPKLKTTVTTMIVRGGPKPATAAAADAGEFVFVNGFGWGLAR